MGRRKTVEDAELLAVARTVFVDDGLGASTRTIAQRAGVSEGVLFQRFHTKAELFFAAMVPASPDLDAILGSPGGAEDPSECIEAVALRVLDYFRDIMPSLVPLLAHPEFSYATFIERHPTSPLNELVEAIRTWLGRLEAEGILAPGSGDTTAITLVSSMSGLALYEAMGVHGGHIADDITRAMAQLVWRGAVAPTSG